MEKKSVNCSDRKEEKDHGADKGSFLGSKLKDGDRVVMIEDVTTSGKSMEETVPKVRSAADVEIVGLMVSLNRMEVGKAEKRALLMKFRKNMDLRLTQLFQWQMLLNILQ